jgi:tetratricopeptide (TPR) repeat protein
VRPEPPEYKPTLFDRLGPDAGGYVRAMSYGAMVFGISMTGGFILLAGGKLTADLGSVASILFAVAKIVFVSALFGAVVTIIAVLISNAAGDTYAHLMVNGSSTPYREQYSYQQALVMQGRVDDAIESFEAIIGEKPDVVDARIKAAELYAREKRNPVRAAELFRDAQRIPTIDIGSDIYVANRLIDLYNGPLGEPGRALVELRRLIDKYPGSAAADHARDALAALKPVHLESTKD